MPQSQEPRLGPDGVMRSADAEKRLNSLFYEMLNTPSGIECLKYLRRLTIETVAGPNVSNEELRHREGQRFIVGLMQTRSTGHILDQSESMNAPKPSTDGNSRPRARHFQSSRFDITA